MTTCTLSFFPDTNLFIQCRPLGELDWSEWADFEEVHLIVCRTVQREIDRQKHYLARFDHPHLNKVHRFFEANGTAYLV